MNLKSTLDHWDLPVIESIKQVHTGLLNQTYIISSKTGIFVLQQLHPAVSLDACTKNYFKTTEFLASEGYVTQRLVKSKSGSFTVKYGDQIWRLLEGVEGQVYTTAQNSDLIFAAGQLLGTFHAALKNFPEQLEESLKMFAYDTVLKKFELYKNQLLKIDNQDINLAVQMIQENFSTLLLPKDLPKQIIHTDPKISNFLFDKNNAGVCMIDLDTVQQLSPLYDIADCARSICGQEEDDPNNTFNKVSFEKLLLGYFSKNNISEREVKLIHQACALVMIGLATRFLNDYIDDNYFGFDNKKYKTRKEHNLARCMGQLALWKSFNEQLN